MGGYGYEIFGGVLIVLSSLVGESMKPKWKASFYAVFVVVAILYSGIGIYLRKAANVRETVERQERQEELAAVRLELSNILAAFHTLQPSVASLSGDVAAMRQGLTTGKMRDPRAAVELEEKATATQRRADNASRALLGALVPGTVRLLRSWKGNWDSPEGRALISNSDYIRNGLLQGVKWTQQDTAASELFVNVNGTGFTNWDPEQVARYLEALVDRLKITLPVTNLSVTAQ